MSWKLLIACHLVENILVHRIVVTLLFSATSEKFVGVDLAHLTGVVHEYMMKLSVGTTVVSIDHMEHRAL